jgi:hypothetical protein
VLSIGDAVDDAGVARVLVAVASVDGVSASSIVTSRSTPSAEMRAWWLVCATPYQPLPDP